MNVALGTDSLASTRTRRGRRPMLSMLDELRELLSIDSALRPELALRWATVNGARALGLSGKAGELCAESWADLIAIPHAGPLDQATQAVVQHHGPVAASLIAGEWALAPGNPVS